LEEKKYLLGLLDDKLLSAESRLGEMKSNLDDTKKDTILDDLTKRLKQAEDKIREKEAELQKALNNNLTLNPTKIHPLNNSNEPTPVIRDVRTQTILVPVLMKFNSKEGWLTKKGGLIPSWNRRWCTLSATDGRLYYARSSTERFLGMIVLRGAYIQHDAAKKSGKEWCFMLMSEFDKRTYYICADNK